ncbi:DUF1189 domain-containing protein [Candidatus Dojkabacteria bacterium]|nr:DUF1189 domain-containing protein [Candidatus Dojkabacteria bacterium]
MNFFEKLIKPVYSREFYAKAAKEPAKKAIGFFTVFTILSTLILAIFFVASMGIKLVKLPSALDEIEDFPEIRIANGELYYSGEMPIEYDNEGQYFAVDTTGTLTEIPSEYYRGALFTKNTMLFRSEESPQDMEITYNQLLENFGISSFELDKEIAQDYINTYGSMLLIGMMVAGPIVMIISKLIWGFIALLVMSLIGTLILSIMGVKEDSFNKSLIISAYVTVPLTYIALIGAFINKLKALAGINFSLGAICCLIPLTWGFIKWTIFFVIGASGVQKSS